MKTSSRLPVERRKKGEPSCLHPASSSLRGAQPVAQQVLDPCRHLLVAGGRGCLHLWGVKIWRTLLPNKRTRGGQAVVSPRGERGDLCFWR